MPIPLSDTIITPGISIPAGIDIPDIGVSSVDMSAFDIREQSVSKKSVYAAYDTIFQNFNLIATPVYNFWVPDELTNDTGVIDHLVNIPRYIDVSWDKAVLPASDQRGAIIPRPGSAPDVITVSSISGLTFVPEHLQESFFPEIVKKLSNGYISNGTIQGIIDIRQNNAKLDTILSNINNSAIHEIVEDIFLSHPSTIGIPINDLIANIYKMSNNVLGTERTSQLQLTQTAHDDIQEFFGSFSVNESPFSNGSLEIRGIQPSLTVSLTTSTTLQNREKYNNIIDIIKKIIRLKRSVSPQHTLHADVNFINTAIAGTAARAQLLAVWEWHHLETIASIANVLPYLEIHASSYQAKPQSDTYNFSNEVIPSFLSVAGVKPIKYVGYILEKYKKRTNSGIFDLVEEINIANASINKYYDTKILYGEIYRYRIKSIVRWTRHKKMGPFGAISDVPGTPGVSAYADTFDTPPFLPSLEAETYAPHKSSYFGGAWNQKWAYASVIDIVPPDHPDELTVRTESHMKHVVITCKLPNDPQRDIVKIIVLKKLKDANNNDITNWTRLDESLNILSDVNGNVLYYDTDVDFFQTNNIKYVYAAQCVSIHGELSVLSEQIMVRLNSEYSDCKRYIEFENEQISCPGVKIENVAAFGVNPPLRLNNEIIIKPNQFNNLRTSFLVSQRKGISSTLYDKSVYVVRTESLTTGKFVDHRLNLQYLNIEDMINVVEASNLSIPDHMNG